MLRKIATGIYLFAVVSAIVAVSALFLVGPSVLDVTSDQLQNGLPILSDGTEEDKQFGKGADPGMTSFPEDPENRTDDMLGSDEIQNHFYQSYMEYRTNQGREALYHDAKGLASVARIHSRSMHENGYVGTASPNGSAFTPEVYDDLVTSCGGVDRAVYVHHTPVIDADGERRNVTSEDVATEVLTSMLDNETTKSTLLQSGYDAVGVGFYITHHTVDNGSIIADVYLTVDYCSDFHNSQLGT